MLNCSGCWDNPCTCGKGYDHLDDDSKRALAARLIGSIPTVSGACKTCEHWQSRDNITTHKYSDIDDEHIKTEAVSEKLSFEQGVCSLLNESVINEPGGISNATIYTRGDDAVFVTGCDFCCVKFKQKETK